MLVAAPKQQKLLRLPKGFELISRHNFDRYTDWMATAISDPTVRPYLSNSGWIDQMKEAPTDDWSKVCLVSEKSLLIATFDRSASATIGIGLWTLGEEKEFASGRALMAIRWLLCRYAFMVRVASSCMVTNKKSLSLHERLYGDPWGIEPAAAWDECEGRFVSVAHFANERQELLGKVGFQLVGVENE
jgi:hypothetical protein